MPRPRLLATQSDPTPGLGMPFDRQPTISVIVPVHNGGESFHRCLASIFQATPPQEVIVVVDGDTDGSWLVADRLGAQVIRLPVAGGPGRARNEGARHAGGEILFFVDSDVTVPADAVSRVADLFTRDPSLTALIGSYDDEPAAPNFLSQYKNLLHHYVHQSAREEASTFWGACGAIRRDAFMALGGFDEGYGRPSVEDIELGYRLRQTGHTILLCKELQVKHLKRWGVLSLLKSDIFDRAVPWTQLMLRHRRLLNDLNLRTSSRMSGLLSFALLASLLGAVWRPKFLAAALACGFLLYSLNASLFRFFRGKRGLRFALQALLWQWFYYFYSSAAFVAGALSYPLCSGAARASQPGNLTSSRRRS
jgi:glycosyltransferase involved in cell wall biosynthesis